MKKLISLLALLVLSLLCLFACGDEANNGTGENDKNDFGNATVFVPGDTVHIVTDSGDSRALGDYIRFHLDSMLRDDNGDGGAENASVYHEKVDSEIVIGHFDEARPATVKAKRALDRIEKESYFDMRYVVYSYDNCIAVAYDYNEYTDLSVLEIVEDEIFDVICGNGSYVALPEGVIASGVVDLISEQEIIDTDILAEAWRSLEAVVGVETADAFRTLYSMYTDDMVEWVANLYDPGVGGFYASSGGRDGAEFGPDVQCTVQLLRFIASSGMVNNISTDAMIHIPEFMQQQMIYFAKSLQDPTNGYFYHPQWGKVLTDTHLSRRGRDLGWATDLLSTFNSSPAWRAPNGTSGDGVTADEYWQSLVDAGLDLGPKPYPSTESPTLSSLMDKTGAETSMTIPLGGNSVAEAVSKVVLASNPEDAVVDSSTAYLATHTNFIDYLLVTVAPGMDSNPYSMGNNLNATYSQIKDASNKLGAYTYTAGDESKSTNPALAVAQFKVNTDTDSTNDITIADIYELFNGMDLKEMTIFVLDEKVNPEIGLWGQVTTSKPKGTEFRYTNGFFKVITLYNSWGFAYPYPEKAANALMEGLMGDEPSTGNICEVYNVWSAISTLKTNLKYVKDTELADSIKQGIRNVLDEKSAAAIENTYNKIKGYKKDDGGFAHSYNNGTSAHQGLPVGISTLNQSDVDATCIGSTGLTRAIFEALGISSYKIPLFTESDWMRMLEIFIDLDPVIKYSYDEANGVPSVRYHEFDSGVPDSALVKYTTGIADNTFTAVDLEGNGVGLINKGTAGAQSYLDYKINSTSITANSVVFETKLMFKDIVAASEPVELRFYNGTTSDTRIYTLYIYVNSKSEGSPVYIAPKSDTAKKVEVGKIGEWFTLSLVYFNGDMTDGVDPSAFKVYINGGDKPVLVDEKFETGTTISARQVGFARFLTMSAFRGKIYMDDMKFAHENRTYVKEDPTHNAGSSGGSTGGTTPAPEYAGLPKTTAGSATTTVDGKVTFDNVTAFPITADNGIVVKDNRQTAWLGHITAVTEDGNSFLRVVDLYDSSEIVADGDGGQCIFLIDRPDYTGSDETFVFEARFRISANSDGKIKNGATMFDITFRNSAEKRVYRTYFGNGKLSLNGGSGAADAGFGVNEWFTVRIEYTVIGADAASASWDVKAYVNNNPVNESSTPTANDYADSLHIDKVGILLSREFIGHLDIDDINIYQK